MFVLQSSTDMQSLLHGFTLNKAWGDDLRISLISSISNELTMLSRLRIIFETFYFIQLIVAGEIFNNIGILIGCFDF